MKRNVFKMFACTLLMVLMLTGCKREETLIDNSVPVEKGKLSFVLPLGGAKSVTYATVAGEAAEYQIDNLFIYWFKASDGKLFKVFQWDSQNGGDFSLVPASTGQQSDYVATISVGDETDNGWFYFVANVNGSSITSSALAGVQVGVTTNTVFENTLAFADDLASVSPDGLVPIATPLPMSINSLQQSGNLYVDVPTVAVGTPVTTAHLKRRVARFDIINHKDYSNFKIENVIITNAHSTGYLLDVDLTGSESFNRDKSIINVSATANGSGTSTGADILDYSGGGTPVSGNDHVPDDFQDEYGNPALDSMYLNKAQFYLYPTVLTNYAATGKTEIMLEGTFMGRETQLYELELKQDIDIKANSLYRILVRRVTENSLIFDLLVVDDWDDADTVYSSAVGKAITFGAVSLNDPTQGTIIPDASANQAKVDTVRYVSANNTVITIKTTGTNLSGTAGSGHVTRASLAAVGAPGVDYVPSDAIASIAAANIVSTTVRTYGVAYETTHTISMPPTDAPIDLKLTLVNSANSQNSKEYYLRSVNYAKTGYEPVKVGNLLWAPVNVGATKLLTSGTFSTDANGAAIAGNFYQWGRNVPFAIDVTPTTAPGPKSDVDAAGLTSFITHATDWISPRVDTLWQGDLAQGPCPAGWRVPTKDEYNIMLGGTRTATSTVVKITNSGGALYFPIAGQRVGTSGAIGSFGTYGCFWTSTPDGASSYLYRADRTNADLSLPRSSAFNVRAVRDVQP